MVLRAVLVLGSASLVFAVGACGGAPEPLDISLAHGSGPEQRTRDQLVRLLREHELEPWIRTRTIRIDETAIPHSHPVLTLHARHLDDDDLLLATFVHEQTHWLLEERGAATAAAVVDLRALVPSVPVGFPEGARDERSSYEHLIVDSLEHAAMRELVGVERARRVIEFWRTDHYRALYAIELDRGAEIARVIERHGLSRR